MYNIYLKDIQIKDSQIETKVMKYFKFVNRAIADTEEKNIFMKDISKPILDIIISFIDIYEKHEYNTNINEKLKEPYIKFIKKVNPLKLHESYIHLIKISDKYDILILLEFLVDYYTRLKIQNK